MAVHRARGQLHITPKNADNSFVPPNSRSPGERDAQRHGWFLDHVYCHRGALANYVRRLTSNADNLDDVVQETLVRVYGFSDYRAIKSPRALLFRVAHNLVVEQARQRKTQSTERVAEMDRLNVYSSEPGLDRQLDARRRVETLCEAIDALPPICRRVFVLRKVHRLSHAEIAQVLGMAHSTIEKHVTKGLLRCRDYLRNAGMLDDDKMRARDDS